MDFVEVLKDKKELIWQEIENYLQNPLPLKGKLKIPQKYQKEVDYHWQMVVDYPQRKGKYLRPTFLLLTAEAMGFPEIKAIKTASAMQTSEDWILAHDDFEDHSLERRGQPTLQCLYGDELAVNAADALHIIMWKMLRDNEEVLGSQKTFAIMDEFYQMLSKTTLGQTVEIKWTQENKDNLTDEDCFFIFDGKTVYYSIAGPMRLGAILAGATNEQLESIYEFAKPLGYCFQIKDDLLDLTSDFSGLKKQKGNDIYEGKRTIMLTHLYKTIKGSEKEKFLVIMSKKRAEKTPAEVGWVIKMMEKHGSLDYGGKLAEKLAVEAKKIFNQKLGFLSKQPAKDQIISGIDFILQRKY
ncbi:MAG: polyprenyl synthetase family protein [Candidatus Shapirobacteria bacterium]|nr:polyprenyl synthetase family protein [Candidatus Shapirobacteria bacterium]